METQAPFASAGVPDLQKDNTLAAQRAERASLGHHLSVEETRWVPIFGGPAFCRGSRRIPGNIHILKGVVWPIFYHVNTAQAIPWAGPKAG